jgi:hypothetical protein
MSGKHEYIGTHLACLSCYTYKEKEQVNYIQQYIIHKHNITALDGGIRKTFSHHIAKKKIQCISDSPWMCYCVHTVCQQNILYVGHFLLRKHFYLDTGKQQEEL